jgi:endoribonuclease Dicer
VCFVAARSPSQCSSSASVAGYLCIAKLLTITHPTQVSWFLTPTVALAHQQQAVIAAHLPVSVGLISGANEPDQWKDRELWCRVLKAHRIVVSTYGVLLNALRHGYIHLGDDIGLLVFDEAHHTADKHAYNHVMREFLPRTRQRRYDRASHDPWTHSESHLWW